MSYPRETDEFSSLTVTSNGVPITTGVSFAIVPDGARPVTFTPAVVLSGKIGITIVGLTPGNYRVFAKVASSPETPVIDCGLFTVT